MKRLAILKRTPKHLKRVSWMIEVHPSDPNRFRTILERGPDSYWLRRYNDTYVGRFDIITTTYITTYL